jgi:type IV pilus assembly protein PilP
MIKRHYIIQAWLIGFTFLSAFFTTLYKHYDHQTQVKAHIQSVQNKPTHPVDAIPSFKPLEQFNYPETAVRSSPFQLKKIDSATTRPNAGRPKQPLEAYALDTLKFTGVIEEKTRRWALIRLPDGRITRIQVGEYMGQNDGKVVAVTENSLIIEEQILQQKVWVKRKVIFRIQGR